MKITMITFATTFFEVMTTIFISKMEGLPPTSATKMIDYWLILLCQLVPFAQVVLLTAMEYLRQEEQETEETREEHGAETKKAWKLLQEKRSNKVVIMARFKVGYMPMLIFIGKLHLTMTKSDAKEFYF